KTLYVSSSVSRYPLNTCEPLQTIFPISFACNDCLDSISTIFILQWKTVLPIESTFCSPIDFLQKEMAPVYSVIPYTCWIGISRLSYALIKLGATAEAPHVIFRIDR